jgi:hypothetical protein
MVAETIEESPLTYEEHEWYVTHDPEEEQSNNGKQQYRDIAKKLQTNEKFARKIKADRDTYLGWQNRRQKDIELRSNNSATPEEKKQGIHIAEPLPEEPILLLGTMAAVSCILAKPQELPRLTEEEAEQLLAKLNELKPSDPMDIDKPI